MTNTARQSGFTMVEAVMSIVIVSVMYVAALQTLGSSRVSESIIADNRRGHELAQQMMNEIIGLPYLDPVSDTGTLGPRTTETTPGNRSLFNDVDDYHGWSEGPPTLKDGTKLTHVADWKRTVEVVWVDPDNPDTVRSSDTGMKRITVVVSRNMKIAATLRALRANVD